MLILRRCPFTGVVNLYDQTEPHFAVGSIARCGTLAATGPAQFAWRCYDMEAPSAGLAPDRETAERKLTNYYALVQGLSPAGGENRLP
jgi:hypothetical protein